MTTATRMNLKLIEYMAPFSNRVDRENRVIKGVKVIGLSSGNSVRVTGIASDETYDYTPEALKAAIPLYEGTVVNLDHPDFELDGSGKRHAVSATKTHQRFGRLVDVHFVEGQGLFADLEYLASNPLSEMILEAAERMPETLALSHNARGDISRKDGKYVVDEIGDVRSVDLIAEKPGTTNSLFEQITDKETKMPDLLTSPEDNEQIDQLKQGEETRLIPELDTDDSALSSEKTIMEEEEEEEVLTEEAAAPADPAAMVESGFRAAINAMLDDDTLSDDALKNKLNELVAKRAETKAIMTADSESGDVSEQEEEKPEEDTAIAESLSVVVKKYREVKRENETIKRENKARDLLESRNIKPTEAQIKAMAALTDEKLQVDLMESFSPVVSRPTRTKRRTTASESISDYPKDSKSFADACKG